MAPKKRLLTLKEKMEIVNAMDKENLSARTTAVRFNIGKTQAAEISKNKNIIRQKWQSGIVNLKEKRSFINPQGLNIDKICFEWFSRARSQNIPISGPLVQTKAKEIAEKYGYQNFKASDGWLQKWRKRHNISFKCITGEVADANEEDATEFMRRIPSLLLDYQPEDVYNADESGLFFRALPDKTLAFKSEKCCGGKLAKERLTILFCANMLGGKEELLVIGKAARPRAFKNVVIKDLPAIWESNKKAWMTQDIMSRWLSQFDRKMGRQKRKVLLFLDNAASHPREINFQNVKIIFLPPNVTSICQPLDQGIIRNFKFYYRNLILKHILSEINSGKKASEISKSINVLEALYFIKTAWNKVSSETIANCFRKAGFNKNINPISGVILDMVEFSDAEEDLPLSTLSELMKGFQELRDNQQFEEFMTIDLNIFTESYDRIENLPVISETINLESESEEEISPVLEELEIKTYNEALKTIDSLKKFATFKEDFTAFQFIKNLETHFENNVLKMDQEKIRQSKISNYFQKTTT